MATLEDLVERIKKVEDILNLSLRQFDKLSGDIDKQIDRKVRVREMEILRTLKRHFEEQIYKLGEEITKRFKTDFKEQINKFEGEVRENIYDEFLPSIERRFENIAKEWGKIVANREMKTETADYLQEIEKVSNDVKEFSTFLKESVLKESGGKMSLVKATEEFERKIIIDALNKANHVQTHAAEILGISRRILKYRMDKLRIQER
jgi:transcriptional regulator with GAF, ATPase, and Fis domain